MKTIDFLNRLNILQSRVENVKFSLKTDSNPVKAYVSLQNISDEIQGYKKELE